MKNRTVERVLYAEVIDMGGMPVRQTFPTQQVAQIDPFLLLHHHVAKMPKGVLPHRTGVAPHPHRGFSPVTFIYKGGVHHRDSRGNNSVIYEGGTQWMNAGRGIIHSERPPQDIMERGGVQEIVQLWINTPAANKMDQPEYFPLQPEETPVVMVDGLKIQVVAGNYNEVTGPVKTKSPILALRLALKAGLTHTLPLPNSYNAFLYLLNGKVKLTGFGLVDALHQVVFNRDGENISFTVEEDTQAILMAGKPLNESVAANGPFVMNTETEVLQAIRDYRMGKLGILIED